LNGKWYGIENDGYTKMHFYPDSLVYDEEYKETVEWTASNHKIEFSLPSNLWLDSIKNVTVKYKLSNNKDTLFGTFINMNGEVKASLLRADNYIEYLNKRYEINFSLPKSNTVKLIEPDKIYGMKIFMGFSNNKIIGKTELSSNLNNLESDIKAFKDSLITGRPEQDFLIELGFHLRIFADKKIPDSVIVKNLPKTTKSYIAKMYDFPKPPNNTLQIKIYRMYQSEERENLGFMKGKKLKTIANTVYN
jgi:hypothetical protein